MTHSQNLGEHYEKEIVLAREWERLECLFVFTDEMPRTMNLRVRLAGRGSRAEITVAYLGKKQDETNMNITLIHDAPDTYGRVTAKAALFDQSRFVLNGMLEITPNGKGADTYFLAKGLMVSPEARAEIYPQLEIRTDEVKASHGSSIGRLDPRQLFYLQSRGIAKTAAEQILLSGFFRDVAQEMPRAYAAKFFQREEV